MKQLKQFSPIIAVFTVMLFSFLAGCGNDEVTSSSSSGWPPDITMKPGQQFVYTTDSLPNGGGTLQTHRGSYDTVQALQTIGGQSCYPVGGFTYDSNTTPPTPIPELYYVRYEAGKFYQYGIRKLIDTSQANTWDLVGDFTVPRGTGYQIATVNYTYSIPGIGSVPFSGPLTGKIADSTYIKQTSNGESIYCYRVELNAAISGSLSGVPITASIFIDYYIGFTTSSFPNNPAGLVDLNLKPFSFLIGGSSPVPRPGYDRKLYSHNP